METIKNLLVNALEGGSNYWYFIEDHNKAEIPECEFLSELLSFENGKMIISDCTGDNGFDTKTVTNNDVLRAWDTFKNEYQEHYQDAINGNDDAITADVFFQLVVLDDVIFG